MSPYVRTVKTGSGAMAVQIVHSSRRGSRDIEHIGSAHDDAELELLKAAARQRLAAGQGELDLGLERTGPPCGARAAARCRSPRRGWAIWWTPLSTSTGCWGSTTRPAGTRSSATWCWHGSSSRPAGSTACGCCRKQAWRRCPTAPSSGACPSVRRTPGGSGCPRRARRMRGWARPAWCSTTCPRCTSRPMRETGSARAGSPKERRLEPQITIGLLTDQGGFPLMVSAFEGNMAETRTMLPVIEAFMAAHQLPDVTIVADAGMVSESNQKEIEAAGLSFILGMRIPRVPYAVAQ
jgi:Transposase DDE domain